MALNGIDISSWNAGIPIENVPADFVIVKATQGTWYVNPEFTTQYAQAKAAGRLLGIYHYAQGGDVEAEAQYFLDHVGDRIGECILALDWEAQDNPRFNGGWDYDWCEQWCQYIEYHTGVQPIIYVQQSMMRAMPRQYPLWVAQYATNNNVYGYEDTPWNEGSYDCLIRQYTSCGYLSGWSNRLDLNKFYGDRNAWLAQASVDHSVPDTVFPSSYDSIFDLALGVMRGEYGNGEARKQALGDKYDEVQSLINHIFSASYDDLADEVIMGKYGNGKDRKIILGERYPYVQSLVNIKLSK